jgi:hypothetical protein
MSEPATVTTTNATKTQVTLPPAEQSHLNGLDYFGIAGGILVGIVLLAAHFNKDSHFDLSFLIKDTKGQITAPRFFALCGWLIASWLMLHMEVAGRLDSVGLIGYLTVCFGIKVASDVTNSRNAPDAKRASAAGHDSDVSKEDR